MITGFSGCSSRVQVPSQQEEVQVAPAVNDALLAGNIGSDLYAEKIKEGAYVINHEFPWPANSMVVEMGTGEIVLVDTPYTPEATHELLNWINQSFGDRKIVAINTGFHFDNLGGNQVLVQNDIPIYGSSLTVQLIDELGEASRNLMLSWLHRPESQRFYKAYQQIPYVSPTVIFELTESDLMRLPFGQEVVEIYYPGETHSPDNVAVYFPENKILFGGCMIKSESSKDLGNTADANLEEWPVSVNRVYEKYSDAAIVVPGHGQWGSTDLIQHTLQLCTETK
ncbi:metallo-beta-lactamase class B [Anoxynatronum buryatiense]|uniref:beta-lactamase n=2 Tax=Anoxynatronum buryatiense TaxID=489973 RepID=A0AA46AJS4_9CLOT|nr:metallo-beta-lactamase class B [Anoxynatronum buryatiense]